MIKFIKSLVLFSICVFVQAAETDLYNFSWLDKDKEVYVLQNRKYRKANKVHLSAGYGMTTSGAFIDSTSIQLRGGYFFSENFGLEGIYAKNSGSENEAAASVRTSGSGSGSIPFTRIVDSYMGGMLMWAPFYSKINTFNSIIYLDIIFGLGVGQIEETNNKLQISNLDPTQPLVTETHTGVMWDFQAKFYLSQSWNIRYDLTAIHYQAMQARKDNPAKVWYNNFDMTLALGFDI